MRALVLLAAGLAALLTAPPALAPELVPPPDEVVNGPCQVRDGADVAMRGTGNAGDEFRFDPASLTVIPGTVVTWTNHGPFPTTPHTTTSDAGLWDSGWVVVGAFYSVQFCAEGTFSYHCEVHPVMQGEIVVDAP